MASEKREIRYVPSPPTALKAVLDTSHLQVGKERCPASGTLYFETAAELLNAPMALIACDRPAVFTGLEEWVTDPSEHRVYKAEDISLVVNVSIPKLRIAETVQKISITDLQKLKSISINIGKWNYDHAQNYYLLIVAALAVNRGVIVGPHAVRMPVWTWLHKTTFQIKVESQNSLFRPIPLDDTLRKRLGLPPGAVKYLDLTSHDVLDELYDATPPELYIDIKILEALSKSPTRPESELYQQHLAYEALAALLGECRSSASGHDLSSWSDVSNTTLGKLVKFLTRNSSKAEECQRMLDIVLTNPSLALAELEDRIRIRDNIDRLLKIQREQS